MTFHSNFANTIELISLKDNGSTVELDFIVEFDTVTATIVGVKVPLVIKPDKRLVKPDRFPSRFREFIDNVLLQILCHSASEELKA